MLLHYPPLMELVFETSFFYNYYLVKYDTDDMPVWVKFVEDVTCQFAKVKTDNDNNIYWTGPFFC